VPREDREITVRSLDLGHMVAYHLDQGPAYDGVMDLPKAAIARMGITTGVDLRSRATHRRGAAWAVRRHS
jgi:hypothetical protein